MRKLKFKYWYLFLEKDQVSLLERVTGENQVSFKTWSLFSIVLPLAPFIISILFNFLVKGGADWGNVFNNGSLPIISYGLITAGIVYIMERINTDNLVVYQIRERIMAIAVLLLFLNSAIFILETTDLKDFSWCQHLFTLLLSVVVYYYSVKISQTMFFLQRKIVDVDFNSELRKEANSKHGQNW